MADSVGAILARESRRTAPDYLAYVPRHWDGSDGDGLNEHFLVFDGPDDSLMAVWTQSPHPAGVARPEGASRQYNHIVFARSGDEGASWSAPTPIAGPRPAAPEDAMASWAFPMVTARGRIYVVFNQHIGLTGWIAMHTGRMGCVYSDDCGESWSVPEEVPFAPTRFDDPAGEIPAEWIVWQTPYRDSHGRFLAGYSHWLHPDRATLDRDAVPNWTWIESVVEFMRFDNLEDHPNPEAIEISRVVSGDDALRVPHYRHPACSVAQEPSVVPLPDGRLFCAMRTCAGAIWWSESSDEGRHWSDPRPLLYRPHGKPLENSVSCDPIYRLSDGRFVILFHNSHGLGEQENLPRNPLYLALGEFRPGSGQPIWFSQAHEFMDTGDRWVDGRIHDDGRHKGLPMYASFSSRGGRDVLWYPDRKFFLLGKRIDAELLDRLTVPGE